MNALDYLVLLGVMLGIILYGLWRTRDQRDLHTYLKGDGNTGWFTIGLSVMATQASAITFLSTPGQGYESGLGFVQNYFGAPIALLIIATVFLPAYRRLKVYTAYEYLGQRFDSKTRLLGAVLFLTQRGLGAGITIYVPAIVLSTVTGWRLDATILCSGILIVAYTVRGGSSAVNLTQRYQIGVIFIGLMAAFAVLLMKLPAGVGISDALAIAGGYHKLQAVDYSLDADKRYTFWSGMLGGMFLALSYFGTDQSQVQRYLAGTSVRESRLGLMFNAVFKIPMQFFILMLGVLVFVFYQFETPPVHFDRVAWQHAVEQGAGQQLHTIKTEFEAAHADRELQVRSWVAARQVGDAAGAETARSAALVAHGRIEKARADTRAALHAADSRAVSNDSDYVFITFVVSHLPHGLIGLLVAVIFAATFASKAGELNALGSTTTVDIYRHIVRPTASDAQCVTMSRWFTAVWGAVAIGFALFASLAENLIQATNIIGSIFYGGVLGLFLLAFFVRTVQGTAAFWGAVLAQVLIILIYLLRKVFPVLDFSYLWYNVIGCGLCMAFALLIQGAIHLRRFVMQTRTMA